MVKSASNQKAFIGIGKRTWCFLQTLQWKKENVVLPRVKRRVGRAELPGNVSKETIFPQSNDSVSFFAPSDLENELQGD